jgi:DNA-binding beta-propeller fold protein YncE
MVFFVVVFAVEVAITPDGKTAYVVNEVDFGSGTVTPINTATGTPGPAIEVGIAL